MPIGYMHYLVLCMVYALVIWWASLGEEPKHSQKLRLCYLADASSIHTQKWTRFFEKKGYEVHVLSLPRTKKTVFFPFKLLVAYLTFKWQIKRIQPNIVHSHYLSNYGLYATLIGFKPHVATAFGSDILETPKENFMVRWVKRQIAKCVIKSAALITTDSEQAHHELKKLGYQSHLIRFGVDTDKFTPNRQRGKFQTVISTRRFEPLYNVESLIHAIPEVVEELPETKFVIAGSGSQETKLKNLAKELGVTKQTMFLGAVDNDDMPFILNTADVYVSTSLADSGIASSTAEAMSCALPIVATDNNENRKWIKQGCIVPNNDSEALSKGIIGTLILASTSLSYGERNRQIIVSKNNYQKEMEKMNKLYLRLAK